MAHPIASASRLVTPVPTDASGIAHAGPSEARWRTWLRHILPVAGVVAVVMLVTAIAGYIYDSNRRGALGLSNDLITAIDRRVAAQMHAYLLPAQQFLELADAAVMGRDVDEGAAEAERFALSALSNVPPITAFSFGDPEGDFLFVVRNDKGGFDTKRVQVEGTSRRVTWTRRDAAGKITAIEDDPADTFDPRTRPWYQGAETTRKPFWTGTYLFFTVQKPGLSFAIPSFGTDGKLRNVLSVDIELATLCAFLKELGIGVSGKAIIVDKQGRVIAYPSDKWLPADRPDVVPPMLDELGDPVLTSTYNRLRVEGYGRKILEVGDQRIIVSSEPVNILTGRDWVTLIVVPEADFVGFVANSGWAALGMSIIVVLIVAALAALMTWRSVQAERRVSAAATRQQALEVRTQTFIGLARGAADSEGFGEESLQGTTESAAEACAANRVAIWRLTSDRRVLQCEDCFDRTANAHTSGLELHRDELPRLFTALEKDQPIDAPNAKGDPRTSELFERYLQPLEIRDVYLAPILAHGHTIGMLSVEGPRRGNRAAGLAAFCDALAILLALRFAAAASTSLPAGTLTTAAPAVAAAMPPPVEAKTADGFTQREARLERTLLQHGGALDEIRKNAASRAAVGVVQLPDWTTIAQRPPDGSERTAMDAIVNELRGIIEQSGVTYAALLDDQIVLAAFSTDAATLAENARCVATALLDLRDRLVALEERWSVTLDFRLGVDIGAIMTSTIATDPPSSNLWGGALGIAKVLAATASRRTIAASETTYEVLSGAFLFRPRGSYFLPETGTMRTFVLVGRT